MTRTSKRRVRLSRDAVLFLVGLGGIIYETVVTQAERPTLLILFAGMVGFPVFLRTDERQAERAVSSREEADGKDAEDA